MWHSIEQQLSTALGNKFRISDKQEIAGGDINRCYLISNGAGYEQQLFVKTNDKRFAEMFQQEAFNLKHIAARAALTCPDVICYGNTSENSFLALEYFELAQPGDDGWSLLGQGLADLHRATEQAMFGWDEDNFIGYNRQPNAWHKHWDTFFAEERIGWQLQLAAEKGNQFGDIDMLVDSVKTRLHRHKPYPSLVHGDLWRGNIGFRDGQPVIYDPACYFGDREVDLAMTELFGALPVEFYRAYNQELPLSEGYEQRKTLYNLYHLLNHANLFGGHYVEQARQTIQQQLL